MYINNFIIESSIQKEYTELEKARMSYKTLTPTELYMKDSVFAFTGAKLSDYQGKKMISQDEKPYYHGKAIIDFYNDDLEEKITFFDSYFTDLDKEQTLTVTPKNILSNVIREIACETEKNRFKINYKGLQEAVQHIIKGELKIAIINESKSFQTLGMIFNELILSE